MRPTRRMCCGPIGPSNDACRPSAATGGFSSGCWRVLIIEDNVDGADSLRMALELEGHEVAVAHDGSSGIAMAAGFHPEILLCDIGLPGMDGFEVAGAFRSNPLLKGTFLVALTGKGLPEDLRRTAEAGFAAHITKPPLLDDLLRTIASAPRLESGPGDSGPR